MDRLGRHSAMYFAGRILSGLFFLAAVVMFMRLAGEEEYGLFSLVYTTILLVFSGTSGWITQAVLRFGPEAAGKPEQHDFILTVRSGTVFSWLAGGLVLGFLVARFPFAGAETVLISCFIYVLLFWFAVRNTMLQAELKPVGSAGYDSLRVSLYFLGPLAIWLVLGQPFTHIVILRGLAFGFAAVTVLGLIIPLFRPGFRPAPGRRVKPDYQRRFLRFGFPMGAWLGLACLVNVLDRYLLAWFLDYQAVGVYSAVYDLVFRAFSLVYLPILTAAHPLIMNYGLADKDASVAVMRKALVSVGLLFPVLLAALWLGAPLLAGFLKLDLAVIRPLLVPLGVGVFCWNLAILVHKPLELEQRTGPMLLCVLAALAVNGVGNLLLIPRFGLAAAAYTTILSALVYLLGVGLMARPFFRGREASS